jgi:hypothetical protein
MDWHGKWVGMVNGLEWIVKNWMMDGEGLFTPLLFV